MFVDLHIHEMRHSPDSSQSLEDIVAMAKRRGLGGIAITDHDSMGLRTYAEAYAKKVGFPIYVGVEYYSLDGDIVAFGLDEFPRERIPAQAFIDLVHQQGGITIACHPFRNNNRGLEHKLLEMKNLTGVEVLNGSTSREANELAYEDCEIIGAAPIGSSDAHRLDRIGKYATFLPEPANTLADLIRLVKQGRTNPALLTPRGYVLLDKTIKNVV